MTPATTAPWRIEVGFLTDTGLARTRNEDAYALYLPYEGEANHSSVDAVFAVADGLGGHAAGDVASRFAADAVVLAFTEADAGVPGQNRQLESWIEELLRQINHELYELAHSDPAHHGMGSTLTLAALRGSSLILGHVGDTRCYRLREGELTQLTEDHSWVAEQRRAGLISAEEEERHPDRNVLTECLGTEQLSRVFTLETTVREGDRFLLCSDGLHGQVSASVLAGVLGEEREPQAAVRRLVEMANHSGGPDNITAVVFELHPAAEPVGEPAEPAPPETGADQHERRSPLADTLPDGLRPTPRRPSRRRVLMAVSAVVLASAAVTGAWIYGGAYLGASGQDPVQFAPEAAPEPSSGIHSGESPVTNSAPLPDPREGERGPDPPPAGITPPDLFEPVQDTAFLTPIPEPEN